MLKSLPERPNLDHLRSQAKDLLRDARQGDQAALERISTALPFKSADTIALHDAQSVIAREYGFDSWTKLVRKVAELLASEGITQPVADRFVRLMLSPLFKEAQRMLDLYPALRNYSLTTALVCAEVMIVKQAIDDLVIQALPPNDWHALEYICYSRIHRVSDQKAKDQLECARALLDAGVDVNTSHMFEDNAPLSILYGAAGDSGNLALTRLLLERGANPNDGESVYHAAQHGWKDILEALREFQADISSRHERWKNTPLYFIAGYRPTDSDSSSALIGMKWLLEHGADPNILSSECEETPLHAVCRA